MKTKLVGIALVVSAALAFSFAPVVASANCGKKCHCHKTHKDKGDTATTSTTTKSTDDKGSATESTTTTTTTK